MTTPYIFIDLSYFVFHRFFALQRWMKLSKQEFATQEEEKQAVIQKFGKVFEDNLIAYKKRMNSEWDKMYIVKDCLRGSIWRKQHYPEYKKHRAERKNDPYIFIYTYNVLLPHLLDKYGFNYIGYEKAEADDIIAVLHSTIRENDPSHPINIITNDHDYLQLLDSHTKIINCNNIELKEKIDPQIMLVFKDWKVIRGDTSDNIPPIHPKIGDKKALKLAQNKEQLCSKLQENDEIKRQYELNKILIDFEYIPSDIKTGVKCLLKN